MIDIAKLKVGDNFKDYTSALTDLRDLKLGWKHE